MDVIADDLRRIVLLSSKRKTPSESHRNSSTTNDNNQNLVEKILHSASKDQIEFNGDLRELLVVNLARLQIEDSFYVKIWIDSMLRWLHINSQFQILNMDDLEFVSLPCMIWYCHEIKLSKNMSAPRGKIAMLLKHTNGKFLLKYFNQCMVNVKRTFFEKRIVFHKAFMRGKERKSATAGSSEKEEAQEESTGEVVKRNDREESA